MGRKLVLVGTVLAAVLAASSSATAADRATPPRAATEKQARPFELSTAVRQFAATKNLSVAAAERAFAEADEIYDFMQAHLRDARFGAVWTSYDRGYEVHVRSLDETFAPAIGDLETKLGRPVQRHVGGARSEDLWVAAEKLRTTAPAVQYRLDFETGALEAQDDQQVPADAIDRRHVRRASKPVPQVSPFTNSGADILYQPGWYAGCTAGFMFGGTTRGYVTAGHCPDGNYSSSFVNGLYSQNTGLGLGLVTEKCPNQGGDYQLVNFAGFPDPAESAFDKRTYPHPLFHFAVAGGFYIGQIVFKVGLFSGDPGQNAQRTNFGTVTSFGSGNVAAGGDCGQGTFSGLFYDNDGLPGDSGGPAFLWYSGWYLGATLSGTNSTTSFGNWIGFINSTGRYVCHYFNPCGGLS